jgi:hypothetical protein
MDRQDAVRNNAPTATEVVLPESAEEDPPGVTTASPWTRLQESAYNPLTAGRLQMDSEADRHLEPRERARASLSSCI